MRIGVAACLVLLAAVTVLERLHTAAEPIETDVAGYAIIGHEMARGRTLYDDLWERKPPLLYATFAAAEAAVGFGPRAVLVVNVAAALATLAGCYAAGRAVGGRAAGVAAATLWTLLGGDLLLEANQPNAEVFANAALTAAVVVLLRPPTRATGWLTGVAFTAATLYEQHVIVTCGTLAAAWVIAGRRPFGPRLRAMTAAAAVGAGVWLAGAAYFAAVGRLPAAVDVLFAQLFHGYGLRTNLAAAFTADHLFAPCLTWVGGPVALVLLAAAADRRFARGPAWVVWTGWAVGTWLVVALPGRFFPHYYQAWLPPMCIAGGWAAGRLVMTATRWPVTVGRAAVTAVAIAVAARQLSAYRLSPRDWANQKYPDQNFVEQAYLGHRLAQVLRPGERFWVLGQDNTIYFTAERSPPSGLLFLEPLMDVRNRSYLPRLIADLDRTRPAVVVERFPCRNWLPPGNPVVPWLAAHYVPAGTNLTCLDYDLWVRRGDADLLARLQHPPPAAPFRREGGPAGP